MINNNNIFLLKNFIIIFFFWASINTGSKYVSETYLNNISINNITYFLRAIFPYIFIIYFFLFFKNKMLIINFIRKNLFLNLFFIYGLLQFIGLVTIGKNLHEHYWIVVLFALILFYAHVNFNKSNAQINLVFNSNYIILFFIFITFASIILKQNITTENLLYHSHIINHGVYNEPFPRASGISRMAVILFFFFNSLYFFHQKKKIKYIIIIFNIFLISLVLLIQSRAAILALFIVFILSNFLFGFKNLIHRAKYLFLLTVIPVLIFVGYPNIKSFLIKNSINLEQKVILKNSSKKLKLTDKLSFDIRDFNVDQEKSNFEKLNKFSNNRLYAWDLLLQLFFKNEINEKAKNNLLSQNYNPSKFILTKKINIYFGGGPQIDRHLLFDDKNLNATGGMLGPYGQNSSNGFLYSLLSAGIFGFVTFLLINFLLIFKIIEIFYKNKRNYFNMNPYLSSSILIIIFLQIRTIFENSFSIFGVDMLILFSCYMFLDYENKKIKIR